MHMYMYVYTCTRTHAHIWINNGRFYIRVAFLYDYCLHSTKTNHQYCVLYSHVCPLIITTKQFTTYINCSNLVCCPSSNLLGRVLYRGLGAMNFPYNFLYFFMLTYHNYLIYNQNLEIITNSFFLNVQHCDEIPHQSGAMHKLLVLLIIKTLLPTFASWERWPPSNELFLIASCRRTIIWRIISNTCSLSFLIGVMIKCLAWLWWSWCDLCFFWKEFHSICYLARWICWKLDTNYLRNWIIFNVLSIEGDFVLINIKPCVIIYK